MNGKISHLRIKWFLIWRCIYEKRLWGIRKYSCQELYDVGFTQYSDVFVLIDYSKSINV